MLFAQQLFGVFGVHGAAILNGQRLSRIFTIESCYYAADKTIHFICLLRRSGFAGTDGPNRLISDDHPAQLLFGYTAQSDLGLHGNHLAGDALLPLFEGFAHAEDDGQPGIKGGADLVTTVATHGAAVFIMGVIVTCSGMFAGYFVGMKVFKMNILECLGGICGGMTSTPALGAIASKTDSQAPVVSYATAYPVALILMTIIAKVIIQTIGGVVGV